MKALIVAADGLEDMELFAVWFRTARGGRGSYPGQSQWTQDHGRTRLSIEPDMPIRELNPGEYDLLVVPGGVSPERLRLREEAVDVARTFMEDDRRVAVSGRGIQLLISAGA